MMFIAKYWYVWSAVMVISYSYAFSNQLGRMRGMMKVSSRSRLENPVEDTFFKGLGKLVIAWAIGTGSMALLIIAIIVNIIQSAG